MRTKNIKNDRFQSTVNAAIDLIYQNGYYATGVRQIAKEIGVTPANIYNFFPGKQQLLVYILENVMKELLEEARYKIDPNDTPLIQLKKAMEIHIRFHGKNQKVAVISDSELRGLEGDNLNKILKLRNEYELLFIEIIEKALEEKEINRSEAKITVYAILNMCTGVAYWYNPEEELTLQEISDKYFIFINNGIFT